MSRYTDGFVIPIPTAKIEDYRRCAELAGQVWREHGALEYRECIADDMRAENLVSFPDLARADEGETVVYSWITFRSREHRDEVNAKAINDPRIRNMMEGEGCPFDCSRMAYGGFETLVEA